MVRPVYSTSSTKDKIHAIDAEFDVGGLQDGLWRDFWTRSSR